MDRQHQAALLESATHGFDCIFENDIVSAKRVFAGKDDPFHLLGAGITAFIEAALGLETPLIEEAGRALTSADATIRKYVKAKQSVDPTDFHPGLEWEVLNADTVVLLGLINALSESYMGYLQCLYSLNSAHSKFTKLYKTVFPDGLDAYLQPRPNLTDRPSALSVASSVASSAGSSTSTLSKPVASQQSKGFFSRWNTSSSLLRNVQNHSPKPEGPVHDFIVSGTAFGYGLFNLVFSLLPKRVQSVVGFFGFTHDRKLALRALSVAAAQQDPHSVFAGLVLMTYYGVVLLLSGYQADEINIVKEYQSIVDKLVKRYPTGALWILNKAKILRMSHEPDKAIQVLQEGLGPDRPLQFKQADGLLAFELAWTLLGQRRYEESANMFLRVRELNTWSHATYYFIAAGCHWSLGNLDRSQQLLDAITGLIDKKFGGKQLPTEVFIKKKIAFYKAKQKRWNRPESRFVESITISPSEEIALFWNTHARISEDVALLHIKEWSSTSPPPTIVSPHLSAVSTPSPSSEPTLDTPDEFALRSLLLGVVHRTIKAYPTSRAFLEDAISRQNQIVNSTWIGSMVMFELAVLNLKEVEEEERQARFGPATIVKWQSAFESATRHLDRAIALATQSTDLSSRLDTRISMLKDEIATKKDLLDLS